MVTVVAALLRWWAEPRPWYEVWRPGSGPLGLLVLVTLIHLIAYLCQTLAPPAP